MDNQNQPILLNERVESKIYLVRSQKVMLDSDLALLYGVPVKQLSRQVSRNSKRFPSDFMFRLTSAESIRLRCQFGTSKNASKRGGRRYKTRVFTEQGVAMLSSVLKSERAILVNIAVIRAFVKLRQLLATHKDLARKLEALEKRYDERFKKVFIAIRLLMKEEENPNRQAIGFKTDGT